jgi:hypothetical protein
MSRTAESPLSIADVGEPVACGAAATCGSSSRERLAQVADEPTSTRTFLLISAGSMSTWIFLAFGA